MEAKGPAQAEEVEKGKEEMRTETDQTLSMI